MGAKDADLSTPVSLIDPKLLLKNPFHKRFKRKIRKVWMLSWVLSLGLSTPSSSGSYIFGTLLFMLDFLPFRKGAEHKQDKKNKIHLGVQGIFNSIRQYMEGTS